MGMVLGMEYSHTSFDQLNDPESNALQIAGSAGGDTSMLKDTESRFLEMGLPFTEKLTTSIAGRYDEYSSAGIGNFSPSITMVYIHWPALLRGTYGEGFRVGAFSQPYGNRSESFLPPALTLEAMV